MLGSAVVDETFTQTLGHWQTFYFTLAGVAATLTGLLFVSVSLRLEQILHPDRAELRLLAVQTFSNFIGVLLGALYFLIPFSRPNELAVPLLVTALAAGVNLLQQGPGGLQ